MRVLLSLLLIACAAAAASPDGAALDRQWADACIKADITALDALMADDLVYVHSSGKVDGKAQIIDAFKSGATKFRTMEFNNVQQKKAGDAIIVHSEPKLAFVAAGKDAVFEGYYLHVWAKRGGKWQLIAHQATRAPQK